MRPLVHVLCLFYGCVALFLGLEILFLSLDRRAEPDLPAGAEILDAPVRAGSDRPAPSFPVASLPPGETGGRPPSRSVVPEPELLPIPGGFELIGTVVVLDAEGVEHREESGSFALEWGTWPKLHNRDVRVEQGSFREVVPPDTELALGSFRLGDRAARCETARVQPPADGRLALVARWGRPMELAVVERTSGAPLGGIEIAAGLRGQRARDIVQTEIDPALVIVRGAASPVLLPDGLGGGNATLWVRAPGYAWGRIDLDLFAGGRRVIALDPAGDLAVEIVDLPADSGAELRLAGGPVAVGAGPVITRLLRSESRFVLTGLPAGTYDARVEYGENPENSDLWGADTAEVLAGTTTHLRILLDSREELEPASPVRGFLSLPRAYLPAKPSLAITFLQAGNPVRSSQKRIALDAMHALDPETYAWSAGNLAPGSYLLEVVPLSARRVLEVRPGGERDVHVQVEPPGELVVVPYDAVSGERVADAIVTWHGAPPEGVTNWTPERVLADPRTRQVEITAPAGDVVLSVQAPGYSAVTTRARVEPGRKGLSVPLERRTELRVSIHDGQAVVPYAGGFQVDASQLGGAGRAMAWRVVDSRCWVELSQGGRYRVTLRVPAAFETPLPQEIAIERGGVAELDFHLQRR